MAGPLRNDLAPPTEGEIRDCVDSGHGVMAMSADNDERVLFIKFACQNGDMAVLWFDALDADYLYRHLRKVLAYETNPADDYSHLKLAPSTPWAHGNAPPPSDRIPQRGPYRRPYPPKK